MRPSRFIFRLLAFLGFMGLFIFLSLNKSRNAPQNAIWSDAEGYYMYLPGTFMYDWKDMPTRTPGWPKVDNRTYTKFTCGVAILQLPVWVTGHVLAGLFGVESNGFSYLDGVLVTTSTIIYYLLGLLLLYQVLSRYYHRALICFAFLLMLVGTNLYFYVVSESGMSHVYSFFTFCLIIFLTDKYWSKPSSGLIWALALTYALTVLIRPTNAIMLFWILGFGVTDLKMLKERCRHFIEKWWRVPIFLTSGMVVFLPQIMYWKMMTGSWISYSYGEEGFSNWSHPKMIQVLTHLENGLLLYSPMLILALVGMAMMVWRKEVNGRLVLLLFILATYIFGSWWDWNFGGAFGHRCFVEYYAVLFFPFCYFLQKIKETGNRRLYLFIGILISIFIIYSLQMTYMYASPWDGPEWTWDEYLVRLRRAF